MGKMSALALRKFQVFVVYYKCLQIFIPQGIEAIKRGFYLFECKFEAYWSVLW